MFNMMVAVGSGTRYGTALTAYQPRRNLHHHQLYIYRMILSVSRYTAKLEEQRMHDAQVSMLVDAGNTVPLEQPADSEAQTAAEPTAKALNNDTEFE